MNSLAEIVNHRSTPGILIFDMSERLVFSNPEGSRIMPCLDCGSAAPSVPGDVLDLCRSVKKNLGGSVMPSCSGACVKVLNGGDETVFSLRAFQVGCHGSDLTPTYIVILVESVVENREPDYESVRVKYRLTKKELQVLRLVCQGLSNKAIGDKMFICVFTVKDHIKNMMRKMGALSRSEMISSVK